MEKGFFDGAMMLLERNVLFEKLASVDAWEGQEAEDREQRPKSLGRAVRKVAERLERNWGVDYSCG